MNLELRHKIILEVFVSIFLLLIYGILYLNANTLIEQSLFSSFDSRLFPKTIILCLVALSCLLLIDSITMLKNYKKGKITHHMRTLITDNEDDYPVMRVVVYIVTLFIYLIAFHYIGFLYSTPFIMLFVAYLLGLKNLVLGAILCVAFTLLLDYTSLHFLQILLPSGELFV